MATSDAVPPAFFQTSKLPVVGLPSNKFDTPLLLMISSTPSLIPFASPNVRDGVSVEYSPDLIQALDVLLKLSVAALKFIVAVDGL